MGSAEAAVHAGNGGRDHERVAQAFDVAAVDYDVVWGTNPVALLFRHAFQERLALRFGKGDRVIDLGCGTGEDAVFLAARGVEVRAVDASPGMLARAQAKANARGLAGRVRFEHDVAESLAGFEPGWHGVYSNFGALNCADLAAVGRRLAQVLRPGAPLLLNFMGRHPLPEVLERVLTGRGPRRREGAVNVGGVPIDVRYPRVSQIHRALGPAFAWRGITALGVVVPGPGHARWVNAHPQAFGLLAMAERLVRGMPGLRTWGDHVIVEGVRR